MPCNSDHMAPNTREIELSKVMTILDELAGSPFNKSHYGGMHPSVYCKSVPKDVADKAVANLCRQLQNRDASQLSLEAQMWWRDHQEVDAARLRREAAEHKTEAARQEALAKLTPYERELLGL